MATFGDLGDGAHFNIIGGTKVVRLVRGGYYRHGTRYNAYCPQLQGQGLFPYFEISPLESVEVLSPVDVAPPEGLRTFEDLVDSLPDAPSSALVSRR